MKNILFLLLAVATFLSCGKENGDKDAMTTINFLLVADDLSDAVQFKYHDIDGPNGPEQGFVTDAVLKPGLTYTGSVSILNGTTTPTTNVNETIMANPEDYRVYFSISPNNVATIDVMDKDSNGMPIGLETRLTTSNQEGDHTLKIQLVRSPDKSATTAAQSGGDIAIEGEFKLYIRQ